MRRAISGNLTLMKRVQTALCVLFLLAPACGGSSSETPMPLEPVPHSGPEPGTAQSKKGADNAAPENNAESSALEADEPRDPPSENSGE